MKNFNLWNNIKLWRISTLILLLLFIFLWIGAFRMYQDLKEPIVIDQTKTVIKRDTVRITEPNEIASYPKGYDTLKFSAESVLNPEMGKCTAEGRKRATEDVRGQIQALLDDSIEVQVQREVKIYQDSTYMAWISGVNPRLDSIEVYQRTIYTEKYLSRKENRIKIKPTITAGYGYGVINKKPDLFIGAGISIIF